MNFFFVKSSFLCEKDSSMYKHIPVGRDLGNDQLQRCNVGKHYIYISAKSYFSDLNSQSNDHTTTTQSLHQNSSSKFT